MPTIRSSFFVMLMRVALVSFVSSWSFCEAFTSKVSCEAFTSKVATPSALPTTSRTSRPWMLYSSSTNRVVAEADKHNSDNSNISGRRLVFQGMESFRAGQITESIQLFNQAATIQPSLQPFLWQRGISLYYAGGDGDAQFFQEASRQFRNDVTVNPLDVEEIVWDIACQLRMSPDPFPPVNAMSLPAGKTDSRRIMVRNESIYVVLWNVCVELAL
jgi:hypothetical protein